MVRLQLLSTELLAKVAEFQAVPGCGLKCNVTQVESLMRNSLSDVEIMNRRNSASSFKVSIDGIITDGGEIIQMDQIEGPCSKPIIQLNLLIVMRKSEYI